MFKKYLLLLVCAVYISAAVSMADYDWTAWNMKTRIPTYAMSTYTYKTVGDLQIALDVWTPPTAAPASGYPIVFAIHGGGDIAGGKQGSMTGAELDEIMRRGWAVVSIDYRLLPGVFLADIVEDCQDAWKWVQTELPKILQVDLKHITVFGQSAGGGLASMSGYLLNPRPQAIIAFYSFCTNWTDPYSYKPGTPADAIVVAAKKLAIPVVTEYSANGTDYKGALWSAALVAGKMGWLVTTHDPKLGFDQIIGSLKGYSTTENVDRNFPPTYLAHGLADTLVPYSQSVQLANSFLQNNITYVIDLVPNANHGFDGDAAFWQQHVLPVFDFAQKYMQSGNMNGETMKFLEK